MKLIVGLGNPGKEYEQTRHNVGFMVLDYLVISSFSHFSGWKMEKKFKSEVCEVVVDGQKVLLARPQTFMNSSGEAVSSLASFYKVAPENILVVHDDLDLPLGSFKLQQGIGPKGHNGVLDVEEKLGSKDFWRLRIGVNNRMTTTQTGEEYVLSKFTTDELSIITNLGSQIKEKTLLWCTK